MCHRYATRIALIEEKEDGYEDVCRLLFLLLYFL